MNAIVVVFTPASDSQPQRGQLVAALQSGTPKMDFHPIPKVDRANPPFWTWFIENPRDTRAAVI